MDFQLNEEQAVLVDAVRSACAPYRDLPREHARAYYYFAQDLQGKLKADGYLDPIGNGLTALEAALIVLEAARVPCLVETAASALVAPHVAGSALEGPVAILSGDLTKPQRLLPVARTALVDVGDDVVVLDLKDAKVAPVESILAYPYGRFAAAPDLSKGRRLGRQAQEALVQWWRVAIALECAAAAEMAVGFTVDYVKERRVFGRPIGTFQAVQHRLAQCHQIALGMRYMALYAAWSGQSGDAAMAASYVQQHVHKLVFDLHQFNGGMGVTNEHKLHFWTYRLRALQAEAGGTNAAALAIADERWPIAAA